METWFFWTVALAFGTMAPSWLLFGRLTMARIEKAIKMDGKPRPCPWDGPGARIVWYAWAIAVPVGRWNPLDDPFIDVELVRRYASDFDRMLAKIMVLSSGAFMIVVIMSIFVD